MCGRFTLSSSGDVLVDAFDLDDPLELIPRYNIAPTQSVLTVTADEHGRRHARPMRWGLVPRWARDPSVGNRLINARAETAAEKPAFRSAFRHRRCIVPADGFYEWRAAPGGKQPYHFHRHDGAPFGIAGLWERWTTPDGDDLLSCTLLTTDANAVVAPVHERMPVILHPDDYSRWLAPDTGAAPDLHTLLCPLPDRELGAHPVSKMVNRPANDDPQCITPLPKQEDLLHV